MELVTGYAGKAHITAVQNGAMNAGLVGSGSYVFNTGEKLSASVITNNLIRIHDGDMIANGRHITIEKGTYEEVEIANGLQGVKRNDLICARYEKNADSGIESASLVVIQGTSTEGTPDDPEYNDNNILDGTLISDFPLYRITLDGLNVGEPEQLFTVVKGINDMQGDIDTLNSNLGTVTEQKDNYLIIGNYGIAWGNDVSMEYYSPSLFHRTIYMPIAFIDSQYTVIVNPVISMSATFRGGVTATTTDRKTNAFTARGMSNNLFSSDSSVGCNWVAIGRVK